LQNNNSTRKLME